MLFQDRTDAGQRLAEKLTAYKNIHSVLVLALPRGGVPVALPIAHALNAPLDIFVVRKLGVPGHEELAMGAIASGGIMIINEIVYRSLPISETQFRTITQRELQEIQRRERAYRGDRPLPRIEDRLIILVDDGLATGATMRVAVQALRQKHPTQIVVAVPVASDETCDEFRDEVDEIVCAVTPQPFVAVGLWYKDFSQTSDEEVRQLLQAAWNRPATV
jgi:putative phosphoribosyl transferase